MAEPKLEIERRLDRIEAAIETMAQWLVQAQTGFNAQDAAGIGKILRGENLKESTDASEESSPETMGVREDGEKLGEKPPLRQQGQTSEEE